MCDILCIYRKKNSFPRSQRKAEKKRKKTLVVLHFLEVAPAPTTGKLKSKRALAVVFTLFDPKGRKPIKKTQVCPRLLQNLFKDRPIKLQNLRPTENDRTTGNKNSSLYISFHEWVDFQVWFYSILLKISLGEKKRSDSKHLNALIRAFNTCVVTLITIFYRLYTPSIEAGLETKECADTDGHEQGRHDRNHGTQRQTPLGLDHLNLP